MESKRVKNDWPECENDALGNIHIHFKCPCCGAQFYGYKNRATCYECSNTKISIKGKS